MSNGFGFISIITAAYNAENTVGQAIESVLAQTYTDFEFIIVNDCSRDGTRAVIEGYAEKDSRIKLINNEKNLGVSLTRKKALENSSGEWIAILDSDDMWLPDKLEKQIKLQRKKNADVVFSSVLYVNPDGEKIDWCLEVPQKTEYRKLLKQNIITNSSAIVRKSLFSEYYAIGDDMHEDFAVWLGILKAGYTAYAVTEPLIYYRVSPSSKSGNKLKSAVMNWKTYRYMKLGLLKSAYYMVWYTMNGILKYKNLK